MTLKENIIQLLNNGVGLTDRQITDLIYGKEKPQQPVNQACRKLEIEGKLVRNKGMRRKRWLD